MYSMSIDCSSLMLALALKLQKIWRPLISILITRDSSTSRHEARISYGNSVRLSVLVSRPSTESSQGEIETPGFHRMIA